MDKKHSLRILCFHGYRQDATIFRQKSGALRKAFKNRIEFEFVTAPLTPNMSVYNDDGTIENGADTNSMSEKEGSSRAWWFSKENGTFSSKDVTEIADGFEETMEFINEFIATNVCFF